MPFDTVISLEIQRFCGGGQFQWEFSFACHTHKAENGIGNSIHNTSFHEKSVRVLCANEIRLDFVMEL